MRKVLLVVLCALAAGCGRYSAPTAPAHAMRASLASLDCGLSTERGMYSGIQHGDEAYVTIYMTSTKWLTDDNPLVLYVNTVGWPEQLGAEYTLTFRPSQCKQVAPGFVKVEVELPDVGATVHADGSPSFYARAETSTGCYLASWWVPFGKGNNG